MAIVIALVNQKGGVGKTTTSINLSACLAVAEKKTLLIDLDPQGNASVGVGLESSSYVDANIYHAIIGEAEMDKCIYKTELPFLDICPSDNNLVGAEMELVSVFARESKLKQAVTSLKTEYDYILIDCPPSLGLLTVNAFCAAHNYVVPLQTEYFAMEGLAQLLNTVKLIKLSLNQGLELTGVLLTMYDGRNNLHKQVAAEIKEHFKEEVFNTIIPRNVKLSECPSFGKPIILYDIESRGSTAYFSLAKEVIARTRPSDSDLSKEKEVDASVADKETKPDIKAESEPKEQEAVVDLIDEVINSPRSSINKHKSVDEKKKEEKTTDYNKPTEYQNLVDYLEEQLF